MERKMLAHSINLSGYQGSKLHPNIKLKKLQALTFFVGSCVCATQI